MTNADKVVKCAIYTRVSTDSGLDQEFNSLDAQYDAASAYIRSQAHARWTLVRRRYDDGGFSGGSTERPALQLLLADIRVGKVDVIVVYKVDRLTRSLADFAKLVELFDAHGVSFVSVTQAFNTTTSMGRLTLNVLLSFAQFEREVTSERIRDKIAASKRKGLWVGGTVPLGYELKEGKLIIVETEAELVRTIFRRYLELGSVSRLVNDLKARKLRSKIRKLSNGSIKGGVAFTQGPLFYMLRNRFYIGEVRFKGEICPAPQTALLDRELFDAVQDRLTAQWSHRTVARSRSMPLLYGLLFDDAGHAMIATHATKNRVRYRYYVSQPHLRGGASTPCGTISRVPAADLEAAIVKALTERFGYEADKINHDFMVENVARIEVCKSKVFLSLKPRATETARLLDHSIQDVEEAAGVANQSLLIAWSKPPSRKARDILLPASVPRNQARPLHAERRLNLIRAIARGRMWLGQLATGAAEDVSQIAAQNNCSIRHVNMTISMAFIAPDLVRAAIEGRLPRGIGIASLRDAPAEWSHQLERLGLTQPT